MNKSKTFGYLVIAAVVLIVFSLTLILGTDSGWGKVKVRNMILTTQDGDRISALLYKPKTATAENPAPALLFAHGGNDMLEQAGNYALELARRGYVVIIWDTIGHHNSDLASGKGEEAVGEKSQLTTRGEKTIFNTLQYYNFVDKEKIVLGGHSMGGVYSMGFSIENSDKVFMQVNVGMNNYGADTNQEHNFHFANILGVADESSLARSDNDVSKVFQAEQLRRIFAGDYVSDVANLPEIEINKVYTVIGTDGQEYHRVAYMPDSTHAYYLVTQDAIQTVIYAITSEVGVGIDPGVNSHADRGKISTIWQWKELGYFLMLASVVFVMFLVASSLLQSQQFADLKLSSNTYVGFEKKSKQWSIALVILVALPILLFRPGITSSRIFLGLDISKLWLIGGTNNSFVSWQWMVSLAMLVFFLIFHFVWGKKHGGNIKNYGFSTGEDKSKRWTYIFKALLFGVLTVGSGYLVFALISAYTHQGLHIATFMMSLINPNRSLAFPVYFLFLVPYFVTTSLAFQSIGITNTPDDTKGMLKSIGMGSGVAVGGLFLVWLIYILVLSKAHTLTSWYYFMEDRMYIYGIAILPLVIGMVVANALNIFISKKTKSSWAGLFTALLWGAWMIICVGGMSKYWYW